MPRRVAVTTRTLLALATVCAMLVAVSGDAASPPRARRNAPSLAYHNGTVMTAAVHAQIFYAGTWAAADVAFLNNMVTFIAQDPW